MDRFAEGQLGTASEVYWNNKKWRARAIHCDVCEQNRPALVDGDERFSCHFSAVTEKAPSSTKLPPFVCSCTKCDLDICSVCIKWVHDPKRACAKLREQFKRQGVTDPKLLGEARESSDMCRLRWFLACPRCGSVVAGKSDTDHDRYAPLFANFDETTDVAMKKQLASRLLRILLEEGPYFAKFIDQKSLDSSLNWFRSIITGNP